MMGSADELPSAPKEKPKFIEDMTDEEAAAAVSSYHSEIPSVKDQYRRRVPFDI